jgi:hypothetical protein
MEKISKFLIDSDILIDFLRGLNEARDFLCKLRKEGELLISVINLVEIYSGKEIKNTKKRKIIDQFLSEFKIIPLDEDLAKLAGEIRLNYYLPFADAIVAATTIYTGSILATRNVKHFSKIKSLKLKSN